jgi:RNA polymerase sigma factor (sigma-70 family)
MNEVVRQLRRVVTRSDGATLSDVELLRAFAASEDGTAFALLVERHGPLVWGVCRRILRDHHAAEDAFQATFLVLARKAGSVAAGELLAGWLHGVARNVARKVRSTLSQTTGRERPLSEAPEPPIAEVSQDNLAAGLDEAIARLPAAYRTVLILCDLEGRTRKEVAELLGLPEGTVASRLARARSLLGRRLGVDALGVLSSLPAAPVPAVLVSTTVELAPLFVTGSSVGIAPNVADLAEGVLRLMMRTKRMALLALLLLLGTVGLPFALPAGGDDQPAREAEKPKEAGGLTGRIVVLSKLPLEGGELKAELVLTNAGPVPVTICTLSGGYRSGDGDRTWFDDTFCPDFWKSDRPRAEEFAKHLVTLNPGQRHSFPILVRGVRGAEGQFKLTASYETGEAFAKQYGTWTGHVKAGPIVIPVR